jgi:hypothetical protein
MPTGHLQGAERLFLTLSHCALLVSPLATGLPKFAMPVHGRPGSHAAARVNARGAANVWITAIAWGTQAMFVAESPLARRRAESFRMGLSGAG